MTTAKEDFMNHLSEVFTVGLQEQAKYVKPQELSILDSKYKELVNAKGTSSLKMLEQLLISTSLVLVNDKTLQKNMSHDSFISLLYSVKQDLRDMFDLIEMHYEKKTK